MACHHVGKETNHQGKRLCEYAEEFDDRHHGCRIGLQEERHIGPENLFPVLLVGKDVDGQHRAQGKEERDVDVARHVGSSGEDGNQSDEITGEDEEEHRQQIRGVLLIVFLSYRRPDEIVIQIGDQHFHHAHKSLRSIALGVAFLIPASTRQEHDDEDGHHNPYLQHRLGDAEIKRANLATICQPLIDLAVVLLA